jgi:hypothetical protein
VTHEGNGKRCAARSVLILCVGSRKTRFFRPLPAPGKHQKTSPPSYLRVTQSERILEATFNEAGERRTCTYFLDSSPSQNLTEGGVPSKDTAQLKGMALLIESVAQVRDTVLHTKQKWQLSRDSKTLTIHWSVGGTSLGITTEVGEWDELYTRQP